MTERSVYEECATVVDSLCAESVASFRVGGGMGGLRTPQGL